MIFVIIFQLFIAALVVEAITELVVKAEIFKPVRNILSKVPGLGKLMKCGYCFSFWAALPLIALGVFSFKLSGNPWLDMPISLLLLQRSSNILHNCIDKFTDKYYHGMYINSSKDED